MVASTDVTARLAPRFCDPNDRSLKYADYPPDFDMIDPPEHLEHWPLLRMHLVQCAEILRYPFHVADKRALKQQKWHRSLTLAAAVFGTLAVLLAIIQLAAPGFSGRLSVPNLTKLEAAYALVATAAVILIAFASKFGWQLGRHQAERIRLLKFGFLIDPASWCGEVEFNQRLDKLRTDVDAVRELTPQKYKDWAKQPDSSERQRFAPTWPADSETLAQLVDYYRAKRAIFQKLYFADRAERYHAKDWFTGRLPPFLFFGSVAAVLVHWFLDRFQTGSALDELGYYFLILAVALPAIGAGVRFYCMSHEFARNKVRYFAKEVGLAHLDDVLKRPSTPDAQLQDMDFCEHELAIEHREWSLLMIETEVIP
jgi:hypothetical protein